MIESIWDGDSRNRSSDNPVRSSPDWRDWEEVIRQIAMTQGQVIGLNGLSFDYNDIDTTTIIAGTEPIIIINSAPWIRFGNDTDYSEFEANGTLEFNGDAIVWDDVRVPLTSTRVGATQIPAFSQIANDGATSVGVYAHIFPDNTLKQVFFVLQMPHGYKEGSDLHAHLHWLPQTTSTATVNWQLEYTIANINSTFGNTVTVAIPQDGVGVVNNHQMTDDSVIDGSGLKISHMLLCRLFRDGGVGDDDFVGDAALLEFDLHFQKNTVGSRQEHIK